MEGADREVLAAAAEWLAAGHPVYLATVLATWGSAPRPVGALLAVRGDGRFAGSVSGGCVEDELVEGLLREPPRAGPPGRLSYGVSAGQAERAGLPCGGRIELVTEPLAEREPVLALLAAVDERRVLARVLDLASGQVHLAPAGPQEPTCRIGDGHLIRVFGPHWRLLLVGAGQLTRFVARLATSLDYEVLVCDPRPALAGSWDLPGTRLVGGMPDDAVREHAADPRAAVVALTHDPRLDDLALMQALESPAGYVGALGSRAHQAKRRQRLAELGLGEVALERLHGPVGLPIGGNTPAEIAVSILAELTAMRHARLAEARGRLAD